MKKIFVDPFTFEVARALHKDLYEKIGDDLSQIGQQATLVGIIFALNDSGFLISEQPGREMWFFFGPGAKDLDHLGDVPDERLEAVTAHMIVFKLNRSELSRSLELSARYRVDLDVDAVKRSWSAVGVIIERVLTGDIRLVGPEVKDGFIVQDLTRSTPKEGQFVWFSLDANKMPSMVDLESPKVFEGQPLRISVRTAAAASDHGRKFVTLGRPTI